MDGTAYIAFRHKDKKLSRTQELAELKMPYRQPRMEGLSHDSCTHAFMAFRHYSPQSDPFWSKN